MVIPQKGTRFRYRPTGIIYEVKEITNQFVILYSMDGLSQILVEKESFAIPFEFEKVAQVEPTQEGAAWDL